MQHELKSGPLLDNQGNLAEAGFSYSAVKDYRRKDVKSGAWRIKEWDYYYVGDNEKGLSITVSDLGYLSMIGVTLFDFRVPVEYSKSILGFFPMGKLALPDNPYQGTVSVRGKGYAVNFDVKGGHHHLSGFFENVCGKKKLSFDLELTDVNRKGMCIATPFEKPKHFYYNYKVNNLLAKGSVVFGGETIDFARTQGVLDWGRGVWTYSNTWYWLSFSGPSGNINVGANLGYGFGDISAASENMFYYRRPDMKEGTAVKLTDVRFEIPVDAKGHDSYMDEWNIKSSDGLIDLRFKPVINRHSQSNILVVKSIQNQVFGYFDGTIVANGEKFPIKHVFGFAEKVYNAW